MNRPNDPRAIHESIIKDIMDLWDGIKDIKDKAKEKEWLNKHPMGMSSSIAKLSSNLTLVFPVICSRGISVDKASIVSKAVEKNAASMLQKVFAAWQIADCEGGPQNFQAFINQFHSNLSTRVASLDDVFDLTSKAGNWAAGKGYMDQKYNHESAEIASFDYEFKKAIREDAKNLDFVLPSAINETSLNQYVVKEGAVKFNTKVDGKDTDEDGANSKGKISLRTGTKDAKSASEYFKNQIPDAEYKKANELMPTPMVVNMRYKDKTDAVGDVVTAMIGVKAKLYPIGSEDIVKHVAEKSKDGNWITNFFRATTREISFMKDFVLAIDKAKIDAMSLSTRQSSSDKMWKVLERRATVSRLKKAMRANNAGAITTLCVSQEEVEVLKKEHNVDLERISTVLGLFESYNLMCICIVDESLEVAKFIFDENEPSWETISFTHLEREASDNTYKRVVNLMTKMR